MEVNRKTGTAEMRKRSDFLEMTDQFFLVHRERIPSKGEDSYLVAVNEKAGIIGAFDGCGGSGAKIYPEFGGKTGAYIASRILSEVTFDWFEECLKEDEKGCRFPADILKKAIDGRLDRLKKHGRAGSLLKGSMSKEFPSTMAVAVVQSSGKKLSANFLWSGDSRVYVLTGDGLKQVTEDDLPVTDAMENLRQDAGMTNVVSASHPYIINERQLTLDQPCIIFAATDGCFGYLKSPMEFEKLLTGTLLASGSIAQWENALDDQFRKTAGDDYTLSALILGYGSFPKLKAAYQKRYEYISRAYPLHPDTTEKALFDQWEEYRRNYEFYQKRNET